MKVIIVMIEWDSVTSRNFRIHCHLLSKCSWISAWMYLKVLSTKFASKILVNLMSWKVQCIYMCVAFFYCYSVSVCTVKCPHMHNYWFSSLPVAQGISWEDNQYICQSYPTGNWAMFLNFFIKYMCTSINGICWQIFGSILHFL